MKTPFNGKIYFYCYPPQLRGDHSYNTAYHYYQHSPVVLAEGLRALGVEFYANTNYWRLAPDTDDYLFQHNPDITPDDCSVVIVNDIDFLCSQMAFPQGLFHPKRNYKTVYLDISDEDPRKDIFHNDFRQFDFIFKAHYSHKSWYPSNVYPWLFGLSERILAETQQVPDFHSRNQKVLVNFRDSRHPHTVRKFVRKHYIPKLQTVLSVDSAIDKPIDPLNNPMDERIQAMSPYELMQCAHTSGRHFPTYYKRLQYTAACACFGGFFTSPLPRNQSSPISQNLRRVVTKLNLKTNRILQWDSWRFWESLAAGCVTFHVDFNKYGFCLPVMPENWKHYIGIDLDQLQESIDRIAQEPEILEKISVAGRQWALEYYNPTAIAQRFLETLCNS
ncbi:MAG: glycosyltransferase [Leptolyngbya sp. BL-A-14]